MSQRACDQCVDRKANYDGCKTHIEANIAEARDERVQFGGGQRNLADENK
ncbi:hypothetical protein HYG81_20925 (plasmid) [Natrinema zhouii]|nr:hypothetical protein [Natrinema zhouii]UHQ98074.1 hypothetical protein HYG81_20925 [Natrinema zhouii]